MPGGMGVNLVKQFKQAGLDKSVTFLSAFTVDGTTLPATKDDALGLFSASQWAPDLDNPTHKAFVAAYEKKSGYLPSLYPSQGFHDPHLIDSALKAANGDHSAHTAVNAAPETDDFHLVSRDFMNHTNHYPHPNNH